MGKVLKTKCVPGPLTLVLIAVVIAVGAFVGSMPMEVKIIH